MELQADNAASLSVAKLQLANCILELGGTAPMDDAVYWDPFAIDDSVLFRVVIVNDSNIVFAPTTPYANLQRRLMCLPLKEAPPAIPAVAARAPDAAPVSFILVFLPDCTGIQ
jgi:hypothetical protein